MNIKQRLQAARELVANHWTTRTNARDADGKSIGWADPEAVSWCAAGALMKCGVFDKFYDTDGTSVAFINDYGGQAAAIAFIDQKIAELPPCE